MATQDSYHQPMLPRERIREVWLELIDMGHDHLECHSAIKERFGINRRTVWEITKDLPRPHVYTHKGTGIGVAPAGHFGWVDSN